MTLLTCPFCGQQICVCPRPPMTFALVLSACLSHRSTT